MKKTLILTSVILLLGTGGAAFASDRETPRADIPRDQWLTASQISERLTAQGFTVRSVEAEHDIYEVRLVDRDGRRMDAKVHPATAAILRSRARGDDRHHDDRERSKY